MSSTWRSGPSPRPSVREAKWAEGGKMTTSLMDHQKELLDQWGKLTKTGFDSLRELSDINAKLVERLSEQQREIIKSCLEASTKEAALIGGSRDPKALLASQAALAAE